MVPLHPDVAIGEAPIGSGFAASIVEVGAGYVAADRREVVGVLRATAGPLAGQEFPLSAGHVSLGRDEGNDIVLADPMVSKRHARLEVGNTIEVVEETARIGIQRRETGGVRVRLMTEAVEEILQAQLGSQRVEVSRHPVEREVDAIPAPREEGAADQREGVGVLLRARPSDLFAEDATYIEPTYGTFEGREAIRGSSAA